MKDSKILAKAYVRGIYKEGYDNPMYAPDVFQSKKDFLAGFNVGKKFKWNIVNDKLPKSDHHCLCWTHSKQTSWFCNFQIGIYENNEWCLLNEDQILGEVTHWIKIKQPK